MAANQLQSDDDLVKEINQLADLSRAADYGDTPLPRGQEQVAITVTRIQACDVRHPSDFHISRGLRTLTSTSPSLPAESS